MGHRTGRVYNSTGVVHLLRPFNGRAWEEGESGGRGEEKDRYRKEKGKIKALRFVSFWKEADSFTPLQSTIRCLTVFLSSFSCETVQYWLLL